MRSKVKISVLIKYLVLCSVALIMLYPLFWVFLSSLKENNEIERYCQKLDTDSKNYLKKIGLVRYNAYKDTGSNLSFALAILNEHNTGIVLNGIYGRDTSNIYAKPIVEGKCEYALSKEEKEALDKAIK